MPFRTKLTQKQITFLLLIAVIFGICGLPLINLLKLGTTRFQPEVFDATLWEVLKNTIVLAFGTTFFSLFLGTLSGFFLNRTDLPLKKHLKSLLLYPYIIPPFLTAIGWVILANPKVGILTSYLPWLDIYTLPGLIFVETLYWYTFVLLNIMNVLENMDGSLEESARMCGAHPVRIFTTITLPLLKPALMGSGILVFLCTISSFGVPAIIGAPGKIYVLTTKIYQWIKIGTPNSILEAMMLSVPIVLFAFLMVYFSEKWMQKSSYATLTGKYNRKLEIRLRKWSWPITLIFLLFSFLALGLPFLTILITSLMDVYGEWHFSLANYRSVLFRQSTLMSLRNSLTLAILGALSISFLSFFIAYYKEKTRFRFRNSLTTFAALPYAAPGTILAMAILFSLTGVHPLWLLLLAYNAKYLNYGIRIMSPALVNIDKSLEESSLMCGASWYKTLINIWIPLLKGTFSTTVFLLLAPLFSELTMSIMLTGPEFPVMGVRLFHLHEYESPNQAAVLAVVILLFILSLNVLIKKLSKGKLGV